MKSLIKSFIAAIMVTSIASCLPGSASDHVNVKTNINTDQLNGLTTSKDYYVGEIHYKVFTNVQGGVAVINVSNDSIFINTLRKRAETYLK